METQDTRRLEAVFTAAEALLQEKPRVLLAIDGRCAAGKTTLAARLQERFSCAVLHMDDFFLQPHQRTPERLAKPGGNVDWERFLIEALLPLSRGERAAFRPYRCHTQSFGEPVALPKAPLTVIEGSYSCHPALRGFYDLRVFLSVPPEEQLRRIEARNGKEGAEAFRQKWIPMEEGYFSACAVEDCCELCLSL